ncbi:unnamed protein product [Boreogadus saida]
MRETRASPPWLFEESVLQHHNLPKVLVHRRTHLEMASNRSWRRWRRALTGDACRAPLAVSLREECACEGWEEGLVRPQGGRRAPGRSQGGTRAPVRPQGLLCSQVSCTTRQWPLLSPQYTLSPGDHQAVGFLLSSQYTLSPGDHQAVGFLLSSQYTLSPGDHQAVGFLLSSQYTLSPGDHPAVASPLLPVHTVHLQSNFC